MILYEKEQKALLELVELLNRGITLLADNDLDEDLFNAYEKYVNSTLKLLDSAYIQDYENIVSRYSSFSSDDFISKISFPVNSFLDVYKTNNEYKNKLEKILNKLIAIMKFILHSC